jgi:hypothetical protein
MNTPRLRLNPADPTFANAVLVDIGRIRATTAGRALFRRLLELGASVTIDKPLPPTSPPNAWTRLANADRQGGDAMIAYDPADWPANRPNPTLPSDAILFGRLLDAIAMASGGDGAKRCEADFPAEVERYLRERSP